MRKSCVLRIDINIAPMKLYAPCRFTVVCTLCANIYFTQSLNLILFKPVILCCGLIPGISASLPDVRRIQEYYARLVPYDPVLFQLTFYPAYPLPAAFEFLRQLLVGDVYVIASHCGDHPDHEPEFEDFAFQPRSPEHEKAFVSVSFFRTDFCVAVVEEFARGFVAEYDLFV